jgi:hypothetical protein
VFMVLFMQGTLAVLAPPMGNLSGFGLVASSTITNTGPSLIAGDIGLTGTSVTGFPPGTLTGTMHIADTQASNAMASAQSIFTY